MNNPNSVRRPHPPILIGGMGERKTLRLVAKYADACDLFDTAAPSRTIMKLASETPSCSDANVMIVR